MPMKGIVSVCVTFCARVGISRRRCRVRGLRGVVCSLIVFSRSRSRSGLTQAQALQQVKIGVRIRVAGRQQLVAVENGIGTGQKA